MAQSTGCNSPLLFEELYSYYAQAEAWYVAPGAQAALQRLKDSGKFLSLLQIHLDTPKLILSPASYAKHQQPPGQIILHLASPNVFSHNDSILPDPM